MVVTRTFTETPITSSSESNSGWGTVSNNKGKRIITGPDLLLELVVSKQEIALSQAAKQLNAPAAVVEQWCEVLEERGELMIRHGLREKFIVSAEVGSMRSWMKMSFSKQAATAHDEKSHADKEQAIKMSLLELDRKIAQLQRYERLRFDYENSAKENMAALKELLAVKARLDARHDSLQKKDQALSIKIDVVAKAARCIADAQAEIEDKEKALFALRSEIKHEKLELEKRSAANYVPTIHMPIMQRVRGAMFSIIK